MSDESNKTPANKEINFEHRVKLFNEEFILLLGKHKFGLGAFPIILPDGRLAAKPQLFDDTPKEKPEDPKVEENKPNLTPA